MHITTPTLQEMKAYQCAHCPLTPKFKVHDTSGLGLPQVTYLCTSHYTDFKHELAKKHQETRCEWCGSTKDQHLTQTIRWGESTGVHYQVCSVCLTRQDELIADEFEDADIDEDPNEGLY